MTKTKWVKGYDFMDDSPRYSFDGRDPQDTLEDIQVVIYREREEEYRGGSKRNYYYGYVRHYPTETVDTIGRFRTLKEAKMETEKLFKEYYERFSTESAVS